MSLMAFDTLEYSKKLKEAGADPNVAEVQAAQTAKIMQELVIEKLVTKEDLKSEILKLEIRLKEFVVRAVFFTVGLLGGLQTLFHFIK